MKKKNQQLISNYSGTKKIMLSETFLKNCTLHVIATEEIKSMNQWNKEAKKKKNERKTFQWIKKKFRISCISST